MKKLFISMFLGISLLIPQISLAAPSFVVPKIVNADFVGKLQRNGTVLVMEQIRFNPGSEPQKHLTRNLRKILADGKQELTFSNFALMDESRQALPFSVTEETDRTIVMFGEKDAMVTKEVVYVLTYTVSGSAISDGDAWTVRTSFLDEQFAYSIPKVTATVVLPRELPNREFQFWCSKLVNGEATECSTRQYRSKDQLLSDAVMGSVSQMPEKGELLIQLKLPKTYLEEATHTIQFFDYIAQYWMYGVLGVIIIGLLITALRHKDTVVEDTSDDATTT